MQASQNAMQSRRTNLLAMPKEASPLQVCTPDAAFEPVSNCSDQYVPFLASIDKSRADASIHRRQCIRGTRSKRSSGNERLTDCRIHGISNSSNSIIHELLGLEPMEWSDQRRSSGPDRWAPGGQRTSVQEAERNPVGEVCWLGNQCRIPVRDEITFPHGQPAPITAKEMLHPTRRL